MANKQYNDNNKTNSKERNYGEETYDKKRNNKKKSKSGKSNRFSNYHNSNTDDSDARISPTNAPSYYSLNPQLVIDSASHSYSDAAGLRLPWSTNVETNGILTPMMPSIPGVMSFRMAPTIGISTDHNSAVNTAARNIYSFVRHANSGHSNYDAPDMMLYLLAMDSLYSFYSFMVRAYGVMRIYPTKNRYYPKAIFDAMGLDYDDFIDDHLSNFREYINTFAVKLGSFCVPTGMQYFDRHMQMYSGVYVDDVSQKASTYLMAPAGFLRYNETAGAGKLDFVSLDSDGITYAPNRLTYSELCKFGNDLVNQVSLSEDIGIMSGDILKAYGENGIFKVSSISAEYMVLPVLDQTMLSQFQNLTMLTRNFKGNTTGFIEALSVTQDPVAGTLKFKPEWNYTNSDKYTTLAGIKLITMPTDIVEPIMTMEATRLSNVVVPNADNSGYTLNTCGSEICLDCFVYMYAADEANPSIWELRSTNVTEEILLTIDQNAQPDGSYANMVEAMNTMGVISVFDWHPNFKVITRHKDANGHVDFYRVPMFMQDVNNYSAFTEVDFQRMNDVALLSEFNCPQVASSTFSLAKK